MSRDPAMKLALGVPVMYNFEGLAKLLRSVQGTEMTLYIQDNWNENIGVAAAWNLFLDQAVSDNIDLLIISNDDVIFEEGSLWKAVHAWQDRPEDCILMTAHTSIAEDGFHPGVADFCCFAVNPKQVLDEIGYFDSENFFPAYFEDNDYLYRIKLSKFRNYLYGGLKVQHEGSRTQFWHGEENRVVSHEAFRDNERRYVEKWGGRPGEETYTIPYGENGKS